MSSIISVFVSLKAPGPYPDKNNENSATEPRHFQALKSMLHGHSFFKELITHSQNTMRNVGRVDIHGIPYYAFCGTISFVYQGDYKKAVETTWSERNSNFSTLTGT